MHSHRINTADHLQTEFRSLFKSEHFALIMWPAVLLCWYPCMILARWNWYYVQCLSSTFSVLNLIDQRQISTNMDHILHANLAPPPCRHTCSSEWQHNGRKNDECRVKLFHDQKLKFCELWNRYKSYPLLWQHHQFIQTHENPLLLPWLCTRLIPFSSVFHTPNKNELSVEMC